MAKRPCTSSVAATLSWKEARAAVRSRRLPWTRRQAAQGEVQVVSRHDEKDKDAKAKAGERSSPEEPRKTSARVRSLVEYERLRASDVVKRASSKTMEDLLSEEDGTRVRYDTAIERIRGVAVLLEMAGVDDVDGVKRAVADHNLDLLHVDCVNATGTSALHAAAANGSMAVIEYLVTEACVDINATDNWGRTPLDEAMRASRQETVRYIIAAGGKRSLADQLDGQDEATPNNSAPNSPRHSLTFEPQLLKSPGNSLRGGNVFRALAANNAVSASSASSGSDLQPSQLLVQRQDSVGGLRRRLSMASLSDALGGSVHDPSTASLSSLRLKGGEDPVSQGIDAAADWEVLPWDVKVDRVVGEGAFERFDAGDGAARSSPSRCSRRTARLTPLPSASSTARCPSGPVWCIRMSCSFSGWGTKLGDLPSWCANSWKCRCSRSC